MSPTAHSGSIIGKVMTDSVLTEQQRHQYTQDGWLIVHDLLSKDECRSFNCHMMNIFEGRKHVAWYQSRAQNNTQADPFSRYRCPLNVHRDDPVQRSIIARPRIAAVLSELIGQPPFLIQSMYLCKPPGDLGVGMHQDSYTIRNEPDTLFACWMALDDTDNDNGGLRVVRATHRQPVLDVRIPADQAQHVRRTETIIIVERDGSRCTQQLTLGEVFDYAPDQEVALTVPAGSGVFFNGRVIHGSQRNNSSDRFRRAFACHYVSQDTHVFRQDLQQKEEA